MTEEIIAQAAHNNAVWCDAVCSTHSGPGEFYPSCWLNRHGAPEYYPDLVTLTGAADITLQTEALVTLMHDASGRSLAVKDSFNCLGLLAFGFTPLFSAEWLSTAAFGTFGLNESKDVQWARITGDADLARLGTGMAPVCRQWETSYLSAEPPIRARYTICLRPRRRRARRRRRIDCCCRCNRRVQCVRVPNCPRGHSAWTGQGSRGELSQTAARGLRERRRSGRCAPGRLQDRGTPADLASACRCQRVGPLPTRCGPSSTSHTKPGLPSSRSVPRTVPSRESMPR